MTGWERTQTDDEQESKTVEQLLRPPASSACSTPLPVISAACFNRQLPPPSQFESVQFLHLLHTVSLHVQTQSRLYEPSVAVLDLPSEESFSREEKEQRGQNEMRKKTKGGSGVPHVGEEGGREWEVEGGDEEKKEEERENRCECGVRLCLDLPA
jgi:hypothetical protein